MMKKLRKLLLFTLFFAFITSLQAQDCNPDDENYSDAYMESRNAAHWSAYVPITILVVAAIYLGFADNDHRGNNCSDTYDDGLGSLGTRGSYYSGYSRSTSGCYCH